MLLRTSTLAVLLLLAPRAAAEPAPARPADRMEASPASGVTTFTAVAGQRPEWESDTDAHCRLATAVADSEAALLLSPQAFGSFGVVNVGASATDAVAPSPTPRLRIGVSYSVAGLRRGLLVRERAGAVCARRRAVSRLLAFVAANEEGQCAAALAAKLRVLDASLPRAREILESTRVALSVSRATLQELNATQLRVESLEVEAYHARLGLEVAKRASLAPRAPLSALLREHEAAQSDVERLDAALRVAGGWDVDLRGGYDQVFGVQQDRVPAFGAVTLTLSPALLFQPSATRRAVEARRSAAGLEVLGAQHRALRVADKLRATRIAELTRLQEVAVLRADLEARQRSLEGIGGEKVKSHAEYLWFELTRVTAEHEYLQVHVAELTALLGPEPSARPLEEAASPGRRGP